MIVFNQFINESNQLELNQLNSMSEPTSTVRATWLTAEKYDLRWTFCESRGGRCDSFVGEMVIGAHPSVQPIGRVVINHIALDLCAAKFHLDSFFF